jgi:hypothetical protein
MSFKRIWGGVALCVTLAVGLCGCNSARMVRWDGTSGVVAIPSNDDTWPEHNREHALALMKEKCPQGYTILSEEEVVVGQVQHTQANSDHVAPGLRRTTEMTSVEDKKEFRITFCSANAPGPSHVVTAPVRQTGATVPLNPPPQGGLPPSPVPVGP